MILQNTVTTAEELQALREEIKRLRNENTQIKNKTLKPIVFTINEKKQVCVEGIGKYSCNMYKSQWQRFIENTDYLKAFIADNIDSLN